MDKIKQLEKKLEGLIEEQSKDKFTESNKWYPKEINKLQKQSKKKPDYVLVLYLRNNYTVCHKLVKVISGNIIVIDNKGHKLNPRFIWKPDKGKFPWYIIRECDTEPVNNLDAPKLKHYRRSTDNHPILMKMVLGALMKKEELKNKKNIGWIIGIAGAALLGWIIFGG